MTERRPYPTRRGVGKLDDDQRQRLLRGYADGVPFPQLTARFGRVCRATIHKLAAEYGVRRNVPDEPAAPAALVPEPRKPGAFTIAEFCEAFRISEAAFGRMQ